jgi:hypothetical protein
MVLHSRRDYTGQEYGITLAVYGIRPIVSLDGDTLVTLSSRPLKERMSFGLAVQVDSCTEQNGDE